MLSPGISCSLCEQGDKTVEHFSLKCEHFAANRNEFHTDINEFVSLFEDLHENDKLP